MARFLLAVWPFTGHAYPNIALAHALRARGHEVAFYTGAMVKASVEQEGFTYFPCDEVAEATAALVGRSRDAIHGYDVPELYQALTDLYTPADDQGPLVRVKRLKSMYRDWFVGTIPQQVADLRTLLAGWEPDVLVCDPFMWGPSLILHETQPVPVVMFSYFAGCLLPGPDAPPFAAGLPRSRNWRTRALTLGVEKARNFFFADITRGVDAMRRRFGLTPLGTSVLEYTKRLPLYLVASVPEFDYLRQDLPPSVRYVGPCLWDKQRHEPPPAWLAETPRDRPVVYITEGTAHVHKAVLLQAAAKGLAHADMQVVMTTGRHREPADLGLANVAPNIRVERWVAHSDLFPKTSAVVTHGGSGSVLSALDAGLPLVVVPMQWDQAENAQRVVAAGAGLRLLPAQCTPERVRAAVDEVLGNPSFAENARRLAEAFRRYGGPKRAAELLEQVSTTTLTQTRLEAVPTP